MEGYSSLYPSSVETSLMKNIFISICIILFNNFVYSQNPSKQIEINPYLRWDSYPKFVYAINSVTSNTVRIKATSWGINAAYKFPVRNKLYFKAGLGYYKYSFNNIDQMNSLFGKSDNRIIDYIPPDPWAPAITYATNKYWYTSIAATIGAEEHIDIAKGVQIICGIDIRNYYTFSQHYHIVYPSPQGTNYKQSTNRYFGFSANLNAGLQKKFDKISIGPTIFLPIYDIWKQDKIFPQEENTKSRNKWFRGFGVGISCNYSIKTLKNVK